MIGASLPVFAPASAQGSQALINAVVLALAAGVAIAAWRMPEGTTLWWFVPVALVPAFDAVIFWDTHVAPVALFSVAILLGLPASPWRKWSAIDVSLVTLGVILLASAAFGAPLYLVAQGLAGWLLCAAAGRAVMTAGLLRRDHIAMLGGVLGTLAAIQMATGFDVSRFTAHSASGEVWAGLQYRYGLARAELTFGHSIALGAVLAICLAFALQMPSRRRSMVLSSLIGVGILATQSRGALLAAVLVVAITVGVDERTDRVIMRRMLRIAIPIGVLALPFFVYYFLLGGRNPYSEVAQGSEYRLGILATAHDAKLLGLARDSVQVAAGQFNWDGAVSIDNTLLYLALYLGWLVALAYITPLILVVLHARREGWSAATISLVGQILLIFTVAPITQYQSVLWFVVGVAAGGASLSPTRHAWRIDDAQTASAPMEATAMSDVACVVVHHRHFPAVLDTIADIRRSGVPDEYIVVVDNSSDSAISSDLIAALEHTAVVIVPNRGYGAAVNAGLDALDERGVETKFVLVSTHEVRIDPTSVRKLRDALEESPRAAVAGPTLVTADGAGVWSRGGELSLLLSIPHHVRHFQELSSGFGSGQPVRREWLDGAICMYDRTVLAEQRFREDFFLYFEETELHCRIGSTGRTVLWIPGARASQSTSGVPPWLLGRNLQLFVSLHGTLLGRWMAAPWTLARRAAGAVLGRRNLADVSSIMRGWQAARHDGFDAPWQESPPL